MKIKKFWVVTRAKQHSTKPDICFKTDMAGMFLQFRGGLTPEEVLAIFAEEKVCPQAAAAEADVCAEAELDARRTYDEATR